MIFVQRCAIHARPVRHESCVGICLFPEVTEGTLLEVVDERLLRACRNAPNEQQKQKREAKSSNTCLPFHHFKLRFDHILRVRPNHHLELTRFDHETHFAIPKRELIARQRKLNVPLFARL
jgi:hypothetical protein